MNTKTQTIVITAGEPAGIGPDICIQLLSKPLPEKLNARLYIIADPELIQQRAALLGLSVELTVHKDFPHHTSKYQSETLNIIPVALKTPGIPGKLDKKNSHYVLECLDLASDLCLQNKVSAMVTGPIQKSIINEAGIHFTGHTEYLAERANATPVMMLATNNMRVALVTTHLPLHAVSSAITAEKLKKTISILHVYLQQHCNIAHPNILICGLNPHAGESGNLGDEEINVIQPVINDCIKEGMNLIGALPADTLFTPRYLESADAVLAMYHDQGLPVLKYSGFGHAVNITLGLPFIRTSVDHGTALDLAGTGKASTSSLLAAIEMALQTN